MIRQAILATLDAGLGYHPNVPHSLIAALLDMLAQPCVQPLSDQFQSELSNENIYSKS